MNKIVNGIEVTMSAEEEASFLAGQATLTSEIDLNAYKESRSKDYGSICDQLDMIYWDRINATNLWEEKITAVKASHPKP